jgi:hypothetical protein
MQYMMMIFADETKWSKLPRERLSTVMDEYREFTQAIVKSGHFRAGAQLQPTSTSTTVREKSGKRLTTDGPFVESKEQLGGYYLVECRDLDEALGIAGRIPGLQLGDVVEIRPLVPTSEAARTSPAR